VIVQSVQELEHELDHLPAGQGVQALAPSAEYVFFAQQLQASAEFAPSVSEYVPAGHLVQVLSD
jgi:hypothetical protein